MRFCSHVHTAAARSTVDTLSGRGMILTLCAAEKNCWQLSVLFAHSLLVACSGSTAASSCGRSLAPCTRTPQGVFCHATSLCANAVDVRGVTMCQLTEPDPTALTFLLILRTQSERRCLHHKDDGGWKRSMPCPRERGLT